MRFGGIRWTLVLHLASDSQRIGHMVRLDGYDAAPAVQEGDYRAGPLAVITRVAPTFPLAELLAMAPDWRWMSDSEVEKYPVEERRMVGIRVG